MTEGRLTATLHILVCVAFVCTVGSSGYLSVGDSHRRLIRADQEECVGGGTCDGHKVIFEYDKNAKFGDKNDLTNDQKMDVPEVIGKFEVNKIPSKAGTIVKTDNFRIDMQGKFKNQNKEYYNLQLQHNVQRSQGKYTTYAAVILAEEDISYLRNRVVRNAFLESFKKVAKVTLRKGQKSCKKANRNRRSDSTNCTISNTTCFVKNFKLFQNSTNCTTTAKPSSSQVQLKSWMQFSLVSLAMVPILFLI